MNGVAAKFERMPSSLRLERITSPWRAACGRISQSGFPASGAGFHQWVGYCAHKIGVAMTVIASNLLISVTRIGVYNAEMRATLVLAAFAASIANAAVLDFSANGFT